MRSSIITPLFLLVIFIAQTSCSLYSSEARECIRTNTSSTNSSTCFAITPTSLSLRQLKEACKQKNFSINQLNQTAETITANELGTDLQAYIQLQKDQQQEIYVFENNQPEDYCHFKGSDQSKKFISDALYNSHLYFNYLKAGL